MYQWTVISTRRCCAGIVEGPKGLSNLLLLDGPVDRARREMASRFPSAERDDDILPQLQRDLKEYFAGRPVEFHVRLDLEGVPPFRRRALDACARIPYGQTATYGELATRIGAPRAARAVGGAMASNRIPIVIPCHRVLASGGRLGGFSAEQGVSLKRALLDMEQAASTAETLL